MLSEKERRLVYRYDAETLWVEAWGKDALRIRASHLHRFPDEDWALTEKPVSTRHSVQINKDGSGSLINGKIKAEVSARGKLIILDTADGKVLLEEYVRNRLDVVDPKCSAIELDAREFHPLSGGSYKVTMRFESQDPDEKIYGMGQYQQPYLNLKGADLEMAQRNSQASVPFAHSSRGYGLLWNNPAVGRAVFGKNIMSFEASSTNVLDYWVVSGNTPAEIQEAYATVTGKVPMMPEYGLGFWQCKLRYQTQEELLNVAREHRKRGLPLDLIVIDFFHWPTQGDFKFDKTYWPDPDGMIAELKELKVELMVSIWPTVDKRSENFETLKEGGHLVRSDRGSRTQSEFEGECTFVDFTSPEARKSVWEICKKNYFDLGVRVFWLDEAEPEFVRYHFDNYRYHLGPTLSVGNVYPSCYSQAFYEGQKAEGQKNIINLVRCAWAGSQKYGALVWSGDIASSWGSFRNQLAAGLNMGLAGLPWWTTDIGGFHGGDPNDPAFRELLVRWFQWGAFCPVMRLHGDREPRQPQQGTTGGAGCRSGADNEVWSYGDEVYPILKRYMELREEMRDYTRQLMKEAHERGTPIMRTLFYVFPQDKEAWSVENQFMYGDRYLVAPVLQPLRRTMSVYLPAGSSWCRFKGKTAEKLQGGQRVQVDAPLEDMPVFERL